MYQWGRHCTLLCRAGTYCSREGFKLSKESFPRSTYIFSHNKCEFTDNSILHSENIIYIFNYFCLPLSVRYNIGLVNTGSDSECLLQNKLSQNIFVTLKRLFILWPPLDQDPVSFPLQQVIFKMLTTVLKEKKTYIRYVRISNDWPLRHLTWRKRKYKPNTKLSLEKTIFLLSVERTSNLSASVRPKVRWWKWIRAFLWAAALDEFVLQHLASLKDKAIVHRCGSDLSIPSFYSMDIACPLLFPKFSIGATDWLRTW